jgi:hypothetical protein
MQQVFPTMIGNLVGINPGRCYLRRLIGLVAQDLGLVGVILCLAQHTGHTLVEDIGIGAGVIHPRGRALSPLLNRLAVVLVCTTGF